MPVIAEMFVVSGISPLHFANEVGPRFRDESDQSIPQVIVLSRSPNHRIQVAVFSAPVGQLFFNGLRWVFVGHDFLQVQGFRFETVQPISLSVDFGLQFDRRRRHRDAGLGRIGVASHASESREHFFRATEFFRANGHLAESQV